MKNEGACCGGANAHERLTEVVESLLETYSDGVGVNASDANQMPRREEVHAIIEKLLEVVFPGFSGKRDFFTWQGAYSTGALLAELYVELTAEIRRAMRCKSGLGCNGKAHGHGHAACADANAPQEGCCAGSDCDSAVMALLTALPEIREAVKLDIEAAYAGDPAAASDVEIVLSYPGIKAITVQRLAHVLYHAQVPLLPRLMTEYAHSQTGIDIHPGAHLGQGIFIDHGTGVVIGETVILGDGARLYQGVTLGAFNFPKDACGMLIKGRKRHPTIGERVTIYSGATVLGDIEIGHDSVIGGNVWLTEPLPPYSKISMAPPEQKIRVSEPRPEA